MSAIHPKITDVLISTFKVPAAEILPDSTMDSLEMDSLAVAEFAVIIKEKLGVDATPTGSTRTPPLPTSPGSSTRRSAAWRRRTARQR